ncbi:MAG: hypothetical protein JWN11_2119 [Hyphomicrobiales bacterium]|nr:hypothetical protein [Hyphomicrobiales bacterium]
MKSIVLALGCTLLLGGCLPMAMFAQGGYSGYKTNMGTYVASSEVNAFCLTPKLRLAIWEFEGQFGKKIVLNSGYRDMWHNYAASGADNSYHKKCMAADFFIPGVPKDQLIAFARRLDLVGGLGCYPGKSFIHMDVRDRPRGAQGPVTFGGCSA